LKVEKLKVEGGGTLEREDEACAREGAPSPLFLQECDSMGVRRWGYAKDVIPWELEVKA